MKQEDYKAIAKIINFRIVNYKFNLERNALITAITKDLADYFDKEEIDKMGSRKMGRTILFNRKQFLKYCGVEE